VPPSDREKIPTIAITPFTMQHDDVRSPGIEGGREGEGRRRGRE